MFGFSFLTPKVIGALVIAAATLAAAGYIFHLGGEAPRAQLAAHEKAVADAYKIRLANERRKTAEQKTLLTSLENERNEARKIAASGWDAYSTSERLRLAAARNLAGERAKSIRTASQFCGDAGKDQRLSDAVQRFRLEARGALDECIEAARDSRWDIQPLLVTAGEQAADLILIKSWALGSRRVNAAP